MQFPLGPIAHVFWCELAVSFREDIDQCSNHGFPLAPKNPLTHHFLPFLTRKPRPSNGRHVGVASYESQRVKRCWKNLPTKTPNASSSNKPSHHFDCICVVWSCILFFLRKKWCERCLSTFLSPFFKTLIQPANKLRVFGHHNCSIPRCLVHTPSPQSSRKLL